MNNFEHDFLKLQKNLSDKTDELNNIYSSISKFIFENSDKFEGKCFMLKNQGQSPIFIKVIHINKIIGTSPYFTISGLKIIPESSFLNEFNSFNFSFDYNIKIDDILNSREISKEKFNDTYIKCINLMKKHTDRSIKISNILSDI